MLILIKYPDWAEGLGWGIACLSLVCVPIGAINQIMKKSSKSFLKHIWQSLHPLPDGLHGVNQAIESKKQLKFNDSQTDFEYKTTL